MIGTCTICGAEGRQVSASPRSRCLDEETCDRNRMWNRWGRSSKGVLLSFGKLFLKRDPGEPKGLSFVEKRSEASRFEEREIAGIVERLESP